MRQFSRVTPVVAVMLLVSLLGSWAVPTVVAQEATPAAEEYMPEGITFETVAFAPGIPLPATGDLSVARLSFDPGTEVPIEAGDPSYALAIIERGQLTIRQDGPLVVTRAGALDAAMSQEETGGASAPTTEAIAAGQEVTAGTGDTVLFSPNAAGEIRNDGQELTVVFVVFVVPTEGIMMGEGTPTP
jgi:hypothetical protein